MDRDQLRRVHFQQRAGRAVKTVAGLALGLALLTAHQLRTWQTPETVWTQAHRVAPSAPRPMVNLAIMAMDRGDLAAADRWLTQAAASAAQQTPDLRRWSEDVITANRAVVAIRRGQIDRAARWLCGAPRWSARGIVAARVSTLCPSS